MWGRGLLISLTGLRLLRHPSSHPTSPHRPSLSSEGSIHSPLPSTHLKAPHPPSNGRGRPKILHLPPLRRRRRKPIPAQIRPQGPRLVSLALPPRRPHHALHPINHHLVHRIRHHRLPPRTPTSGSDLTEYHHPACGHLEAFEGGERGRRERGVDAAREFRWGGVGVCEEGV